MSKIKVFQVISELGDGGVESMLINAYKNLDRRKIKFFFVVQNEKRNRCSDIKNLGGEVIQIKPLKTNGLINYIKELKELFIKYDADVVHCHNLTQNPVVLFAAYLAKVEIRISHSHLTTCFSKKARMMMPLVRIAINCLATDKLACGKEAGKFLYGKRDFLIIRNGIDLSVFKNDKRRVVKDLPTETNKKYKILHVGRLSEQKNHRYLLEIAERTSDNVCFLCCGDGPLHDEIENLIIEKKLEKKVFLLGSRNDVSDLMTKSDLIIMPSLYEGFPVTLIESQASGLKALVSDRVDPESDLGLNLVDFLPISLANVGLWVDRINFYMNCGYVYDEKNIQKCLANAGYDSKTSYILLSKIYTGKWKKNGKKKRLS